MNSLTRGTQKWVPSAVPGVVELKGGRSVASCSIIIGLGVGLVPMVFSSDQVVLERCEKFLSPIYWTDVNIRSQMFPLRLPFGEMEMLLLRPEEPHLPFPRVQEMKTEGRFRPCVVGDVFGPAWATVWFYLKVALPGPLHDRHVGIRWDSSSEAMLFSSQGDYLQAFTGGDGADRRDLFLLPRLASKGETLEFFVEMACNGMFGNGLGGMIRPPDEKSSFQLRVAEVVEVNLPLHSLFWDLTALHSLASHSKDSAVSSQIITTISWILNKVDISDASSVLACHRKAEEAMLGSQVNHDITAVGHCHIDTAWLWPYRETRRKVMRSWSTQLALMESYPEWRFVASQGVQFEWLMQDHPQLFNRIVDKIQTGRFIPVGGTYVEFDANIPSAESFIRQFLYGSQFFEKTLGVQTDVFWLPDTFGYSAQLPQIMRGFGMKYFLSQKLSWNLFNTFPHSSFEWEGIDGSRVIAHFPPADSYNATCSAEDFLKSVSNHKSLKSSNRSMVLFGHGNYEA